VAAPVIACLRPRFSRPACHGRQHERLSRRRMGCLSHHRLCDRKAGIVVEGLRHAQPDDRQGRTALRRQYQDGWARHLQGDLSFHAARGQRLTARSGWSTVDHPCLVSAFAPTSLRCPAPSLVFVIAGWKLISRLNCVLMQDLWIVVRMSQSFEQRAARQFAFRTGLH
jgi:hypothetical protein